MNNLGDFEINQFQLNNLLNHNEKKAFKYLLDNGVFCSSCNDICKDGVINYKIYLDRFNDIKVIGQCFTCNHKVTRIMEFGENESFFRKAVQFKNTHTLLAKD